MTGQNDTLRAHPYQVVNAIALLSRWPLRYREQHGPGFWAFPLAGLAISLPPIAVGFGAIWLGLGPLIASILCVGTFTVTTGGLHEDGLADSADGLWGGHDRARRLEIMKDSHIGSYGVLALILSLLLRVAAVYTLFAAPILPVVLIFPAVLSRGVLPVLARALPHARADGLSHMVGRPGPWAVWAALTLSVLPILLTAPDLARWGLPAAVLASLACGLIAKSKIGGQTGDILGATQQVTEIAVLLALVAAIA